MRERERERERVLQTFGTSLRPDVKDSDVAHRHFRIDRISFRGGLSIRTGFYLLHTHITYLVSASGFVVNKSGSVRCADRSSPEIVKEAVMTIYSFMGILS